MGKHYHTYVDTSGVERELRKQREAQTRAYAEQNALAEKQIAAQEEAAERSALQAEAAAFQKLSPEERREFLRAFTAAKTTLEADVSAAEAAYAAMPDETKTRTTKYCGPKTIIAHVACFPITLCEYSLRMCGVVCMCDCQRLSNCCDPELGFFRKIMYDKHEVPYKVRPPPPEALVKLRARKRHYERAAAEVYGTSGGKPGGGEVLDVASFLAKKALAEEEGGAAGARPPPAAAATAAPQQERASRGPAAA